MDAPQRRLYHLHADWGHSPAGYITDYVLFVVAILCFSSAWAVLRFVKIEVHRRALVVFMAGILTTGFSFLFGGIAHHMLDSYPHGEPYGMTWGSTNSGWMALWLMAMVLAAPGFAMLTSVPWACAGSSGPILWVQYALWGLGCVEAVVELVILLAGQLASSGIIMGLLVIAMLLLATGASLVFAAKKRCGLGESLLALGYFVGLLAHVVLLTTPDECKSHHDHADCPFSASFNHNAVFHTIFTVCEIILCVGVLATVRPREENKEVAPQME